MSRRLRGVLTAAIALATCTTPAPATLATTVSVRIVGDGVALDATTVDTTAASIGPDSCPGDSAGGAIDKAVAGDWDRLAFVSTILGESHTYANRDYWNFWINDAYSQTGICSYAVHPNDRILMLVQRDDASSKPTVFPLTLSGVPRQVTADAPFTVSVVEQHSDGTTTTPAPIAGATVSGGGGSAQTDAAGNATLTLSIPGDVALTARRTGDVPSEAAAVSVLAAGAPLPMPPACETSGRDGLCGSSDLVAPHARITAIAYGQRFSRASAPRTLHVSVAPDPSGLHAVKLRLTRTDGRRCTYFSGGSERFKLGKHGRCGAENGFWFGVGAAQQTDYLLPSKLPRGRYVLDANAIDKAYNRDDARVRGFNRVVFRVA